MEENQDEQIDYAKVWNDACRRVPRGLDKKARSVGIEKRPRRDLRETVSRFFDEIARETEESLPDSLQRLNDRIQTLEKVHLAPIGLIGFAFGAAIMGADFFPGSSLDQAMVAVEDFMYLHTDKMAVISLGMSVLVSIPAIALESLTSKFCREKKSIMGRALAERIGDLNTLIAEHNVPVYFVVQEKFLDRDRLTLEFMARKGDTYIQWVEEDAARGTLIPDFLIVAAGDRGD